MIRPVWVSVTPQDGHSIGLDSAGRLFELRHGELEPIKDPPPIERPPEAIRRTSGKVPRRRK